MRFHRQVRSLDQPDDLQLFRCRIPHAASPPSAIMLFLSRRSFPEVFAQQQCFLQITRSHDFRLVHFARTWPARAVSPARAFFSCFEELLRPAVVLALQQCLHWLAQFGRSCLSPRSPSKDDAYLVFSMNSAYAVFRRLISLTCAISRIGMTFGCIVLISYHSKDGEDEPKTLP